MTPAEQLAVIVIARRMIPPTLALVTARDFRPAVPYDSTHYGCEYCGKMSTVPRVHVTRPLPCAVLAKQGFKRELGGVILCATCHGSVAASCSYTPDPEPDPLKGAY